MRKFLKTANEARLSSIQKDVLLYYISRTANPDGIWYCPDDKTAEEICRSRNGVCAARLKLIKEKWISEESPFLIRVIKDIFSVPNETENENPVSNETQTNYSQPEIKSEPQNVSLKSDSPVRNGTETGESSVSFRTQPPQTPQKEIYNTQREIKKVKGKKEVKRESGNAPPPLCHNKIASHRFQPSARNISAQVATQIVPIRSIWDCEALTFYESTFKIRVGNHTAEEIRMRIKNLDVWKTLIRDKIAYADQALPQRNKISNWIFTAYEERINKLGENNDGKKLSSREKRTQDAVNKQQLQQSIRANPNRK